jgi:hypothetical protein
MVIAEMSQPLGVAAIVHCGPTEVLGEGLGEIRKTTMFLFPQSFYSRFNKQELRKPIATEKLLLLEFE